MKKGTEGYVLIYVLVVFILLGLACTTVCTFALNGLKTQRTALESDRQRFAAEGLVEQAVARLLDADLGVVKLTDSGFETDVEARNALESAYESWIEDLENPDLTVDSTPGSWDSENKNCTFETEIQSELEGQQVSAVLSVTLPVSIDSYSVDVGEPDPETGVQPTETRWKYSVTSASLSYDSYQIQAVEPEGGSGP